MYETHRPRACFALFSGGHDSLSATSVAFEWAISREVPLQAVHINTGTGIPETTEFVRRVCVERGWELREYEPPRPYEDIVLEYGFPGPANHGFMYQRLKERCLRQLVREHKREVKDRIMLVTGIRAEESVRRMRHVERVQRDGAQVWAAAIWNWSKLDCTRWLAENGLPRNEVVDKIHMSGECLCGAFARPGEREELRAWFPEKVAEIETLERRAEAAGLRACRWGQRPPRVHREQMQMLDSSYETAVTGPLCVGCDGQHVEDHAADRDRIPAGDP